MVEGDKFYSPEAVAARQGAADAARIVHEFGDPNSGDYHDPYGEGPFEYPTSLVKPRTTHATRMEIGDVYKA